MRIELAEITKLAFPPLSLREAEVLQLLVTNITNKDIAPKLNISVRTVESHRESIMYKLDVHTIPGLIFWAIDHQLIFIEPMEIEPGGAFPDKKLSLTILDSTGAIVR